MKKVLISLILSIFLGSCSLYNSLDLKEISVGDQSFTCQIASTPEQQKQGLMNVSSLAPNHGMLFEFENPGVHTFWMKNTLIPLDIIWIDAHQRVSHHVTAQPCTADPCATYEHNQEVKYVLEVSAGTFLGKIGDPLIFKTK